MATKKKTIDDFADRWDSPAFTLTSKPKTTTKKTKKKSSKGKK